MSTGGKKGCGASEWMRVGKTEVVSFMGFLQSEREGRAAGSFMNEM